MQPRWFILTIGLVCYAILMGWLASSLFLLLQFDSLGEVWAVVIDPSEWVNALYSETWWSCCCTPMLLLIASQAAFVVPIITFRPRRKGRATSLVFSMIAAALVAAALCVGLACGMYSLAELIWGNQRAVITDDDETLLAIAGGLLLASWVIWSIIFVRFAAKRRGENVIGRVIGLLLGGTLVESALILPIDIMIRRQTQCYCETGSFFALCLCIWSILWLAGPGAIVVLFRKRHRTWFELHCEMCGYEKGPSPGENCPECGCAWNDGLRTQSQAAK